MVLYPVLILYSTGTQFIEYLNDWTLNIEKKQSLNIIYKPR